MAVPPRLRSDLVVSSSTENGTTLFTVKEPVAGKYIRLRAPEYWLISQFDGQSSANDLAAKFHEKFGFAMTGSAVMEFAGALERVGLLAAETGVSESEKPAPPKATRADNLLHLQLASFRPGKFLDRLAGMYRPFHRWPWFVVQFIVMVLGVGVLVANSENFAVHLAQLFNIASIATIVISLFLLVAFHELAHAVACRYHGGEVRAMGILLLYFQPAFFADISDAWLFPKKRQRLVVTLAGLWSQTLFMALAVVIWRVTVAGTAINTLAHIFGIVCWITLLFNFNPLIKLDGYYLLSDWVGLPNLRARSFAYLKNVIQRHILGWSVTRVEVTPRERKIFLVYALLSLVFSIFLLGYIFLAASRFVLAATGGPGLVLFLAGLAVILRKSILSILRGIARHVAHMKSLLHKPVRLVSYLIVLIAVIVFVFTVPFPHRVSGDILVRPLSEFTVALNEYGLLESAYRVGGASPENKSNFVQIVSNEATSLQLQPRVRDGQPVNVGDTVAVLLSNQISQQIALAQSELERLRDQLRLLKAPPKKEQVATAQAEVSAARANYEQLKREQKRVEELVAKNLGTQEKLESARSATEIARAELNNKTSYLALVKSPPRPEEEAVLRRSVAKQETTLDFLMKQAEAQVITTPIAGQVAVRSEGKRSIAIVNSTLVELSVPVSDFDISLVEIGQKVDVKVRSYPDRVFEGSVVRIPGAAEPIGNTACFPVSVVVNNDDQTLRSGMSGYAKIEAGTASLAALAWRKCMSIIKVEFWSWW
ncbi:MAG: HlyD family efflux transporter periplasmic adaptor subunit [candidate division Zixibacteria bacterium]|nr:HlyD family efflux transporter periplasmic adaptor subunit [candidate division Zixibacteria bacterium]